MPTSVSTPDALDLRERTAPFVPAGLTGRDVEATATTVLPITYELRPVGSVRGTPLGADPNAPAQAYPLRLFAHGVSTFIVVLAVGLTMISMAPQLFGYDPVVVTSGSMEPSIRTADVVVTAPTDGQNLGRGSVINFERGDGTILHRITDVADTGYRTTGDANRVADSELVEPGDITGVGIVVVPFVGLPRQWADEGKWFHLLGAAAVLAAAMYMSRVSWAVPSRQPWAP